MAHRVVGEIGKDDGGVLLGDAHRRIEVATRLNIKCCEGRAQSGYGVGEFGGAQRNRIFRAGEIAQTHRDFRQPISVRDDVIEEFSPVLVVHRRRVDIVAQKLGGALYRRQWRLQFVRHMGGEGRDKAGTRIQPPRHFEKALRQAGEFAGAVAPERTQGFAVAVADQVGTLDQLPHRFGDGAMKQETDQKRRDNHEEHREGDFSTLLVEVFEDIAGRARGINDACDLVPRDHGHRGKDAHAGTPAHGIERGLVMLGDAHAQGAAEAPLQRLGYFLQVHERQPDLLAAGDDDAVRVEQPKPRERHALRCDEIRHHARAERDEGGISRRGWRAGLRPRRQQALIGKFELRPDRLIRLARWLLSGRRNPCPERDALRNSGFDFATKDGGEGRTLRDQFGFGLLDQLVLVDLEEIEAEQGKQQHAGKNKEDDEAETWPPLPRRSGRRSGGVDQRDASQRPSLKPTPWTVSMTDSQPAALIFARMFLTWLSMVRSATWMFPA